MASIARPALALSAILALSWALPSPAQAKEWDQAAVTEIAKQLADAAGTVRQSVRRAGPPPPGSSQRRVHFQALDDLRVIQGSIRSLARRLEHGAGRDETFPTFQRIRTLRNDIAQAAGHADVREPTLSQLEKAGELLAKLEPYYSEQ
ncbi:MAG: hypothetical protein QNK05_08520 [Myxococcota bacterium]|nr:hypothetical protein [Myxococcota bacterium]